ncbi:MAG: hypothetical protein OXC45_02360 [Gemmatimonadetes bacterium]|nr:hypothetical protein [Gemmatimonadota bacterium]
MHKYILLCVLMWSISCSQHYEEGAHPPPKPPPAQAPAADKEGPQVSDAVVSGTIRLADGLDQRIGGNAVLFVIARPAPVGGPPLAVKRLDISDFPLSYTLTRGDAMIEIDWSEIDALYVSAKIDSDGRVGGSKTGDMEGIYPQNPVAPGAVEVDILIDMVH